MPVTKELLRLDKPGHAAHKYMIMRADTRQLVYAVPPTGWLPCAVQGMMHAWAWAWNYNNPGSVYDGFDWTIPGMQSAIDSAFNALPAGWTDLDYANDDGAAGLARATYGYYMSPRNPNPSLGMVTNSSMYGVGAIAVGPPAYLMGTYTQVAVSLYGGCSVFGRLSSVAVPTFAGRTDASFPNLNYSLTIIAHNQSLTPRQVATGSFTGGEITTVTPAQLNNGAAAYGTGLSWYAYHPEATNVNYYYQTAPSFANYGWHARIVLPAAAMAILSGAGATVYFRFNPAYPTTPTLDDRYSIFFNDLISARIEVYST